MNEAHFHLAVNHFPIVGVVIGLLVLITGLLVKKLPIKVTALGIFIFSAITSVAAFYSGEGAEEIVENLSGISETMIHTHEEYAELFFTAILVLGFSSAVILLLQRYKSKYASYGFIWVLVLAVGSTILAAYVGTSGGEIRHTEIRTENGIIQLDSNNDHDDN